MRTTHTYAVLEVTAATYAEIRSSLEKAGYEHAFHDDVIDMHGIAIKADGRTAIVVPTPPPIPGGYPRDGQG